MDEGSVVNEEVERLRWMVYYSGMEEKKPHWIHDEATDSTSVTGKKYLISCTCSECGYHANMEKPICPQCKARIMDLKLAVLMLTMTKIRKVARMLVERKAA